MKKSWKRTVCFALLTFCMLILSIVGVSAKSVMAGDINADGSVTAADARMVLRAAASLEALSDEQRIIADADSNGRITAADARLILRVSAHLENALGFIELPDKPVYLNTFMDNDDGEMEFFTADCRGEKMDGCVLKYKQNIVLIDGGFSGTDTGTVYHYLYSLRETLLPVGVDVNDENYKLKLTLVISHFHMDHVQTLITDILPSPYFEIASVYAAAQSDFENTSYYSDASLCNKNHYVDGVITKKGRLALLNTLNDCSPDAEIHFVGFGETMCFFTDDGKVKFECFAPSQDWGTEENAQKILDLYYNGGTAENTPVKFPTSVANANSMWLKVTYGDIRLLFTGDVMKKKSFAYLPTDADYVGEPFDLMLSYYGEKYGEDVFEADIVKFPHHGTLRAQASKGVFEVFRPSIVVCTAANYDTTTIKKAKEYWDKYTGECYLAEGDGLYIYTDGKSIASVFANLSA